MLLESFGRGVSTAGSRRGHFWRARGGVLLTVGGAGVDGEVILMTEWPTFCLRTTNRQFLELPVWCVLRDPSCRLHRPPHTLYELTMP
jgi:hypothetical protein